MNGLPSCLVFMAFAHPTIGPRFPGYWCSAKPSPGPLCPVGSGAFYANSIRFGTHWPTTSKTKAFGLAWKGFHGCSTEFVDCAALRDGLRVLWSMVVKWCTGLRVVITQIAMLVVEHRLVGGDL